jgi:hypothetical protein
VFTGQLTGTDLATALASADVFLNPSITETFGNASLEAVACSLPVLAARLWHYQPVQHGVTGQLAEPGDIDAFAEERRCTSATGPAHQTGAAGLSSKTMDWDEINAAVMRLGVFERRRRLNPRRS